MSDRLWNGGEGPRSTLCAAGIEPTRLGCRVQRSRRKGARTPEGAIYVGKPTMWGNPFEYRGWGHAKATILHDNWLRGRLGGLTLENMGFSGAEIDALWRLRCRVLRNLHTLAGHDLTCWCATTSEWCHAVTLLRMVPAHVDYERWAA